MTEETTMPTHATTGFDTRQDPRPTAQTHPASACSTSSLRLIGVQVGGKGSRP